MATITIRNLDDALHAELKRDARANHRSLEAEARVRLGQKPKMIATESLADRFRRTMVDPGPGYEGSVALIRAIRDEE